jgi:hypothetical protein
MKEQKEVYLCLPLGHGLSCECFFLRHKALVRLVKQALVAYDASVRRTGVFLHFLGGKEGLLK